MPSTATPSPTPTPPGPTPARGATPSLPPSSEPAPGLPARRPRLAALCRDLDTRTARQAGTLGFVPRALVQANLPYRAVPGTTFTRRAGHHRLHLQAPPEIGLPYGRYPRLLLAWLATEAVRTRQPHLDCGPSFSRFLALLGLSPSAGDRGPMNRVRDQLTRLLATAVTTTWTAPDHRRVEGFHLARDAYLWWEPTDPDRPLDPHSSVTLGLDFFQELLAAPVPVDLRILRALRSPLALDVYCWLTYRLHTLRHPTRLPWDHLHDQFGSRFSRLRDFRRAFVQALRKVLQLYPHPRLHAHPEHLLLHPLPHAVRHPLD